MSTLNVSDWEVPNYDIVEFREKKSKYCICIPVINEGDNIQNQLKKMRKYTDNIDVILADGGSTDGSTKSDFLRNMNIKCLLVKTGPGKLSAQLRMAFAYALREGYEGIITIDGNNKDSVETIPEFIQSLDEGYNFVQGSRFVPGGYGINTPFLRLIAIKLIHAPYISLLAGFRYTDTTNGFRAHSRAFLLDNNVQPFRELFNTYELLAYLSVKAPKLGYKTKEIPVTRSYPKNQKIPTKISPISGNFLLLKILMYLGLRRYEPSKKLKS
jgi:dolichol-phosphate mannosyltransferase